MPGSLRIPTPTRLFAIAEALTLAAGLSGCATAGAMQRGDSLVFQNASPDVVRVSLYSASHEVLLGRVGPFERAPLVIRPAMFPPESEVACLVVVPVGAPSITKPGPQNAGAIWSEFYPVPDVTRQLWTYSGSRVLATSLPNPRR